jgi:hypothetical protein
VKRLSSAARIARGALLASLGGASLAASPPATKATLGQPVTLMRLDR